MKTQAARGAKREHQVADLLRLEGWIVYRSAGSHGNADLVALHVGFPPMLVQVKSSRRPFEHFGPAERRELEVEALMAGAVPQLCHWPAHGQPRFLGRFEWPGRSVDDDDYEPGGEFDLRLSRARV